MEFTAPEKLDNILIDDVDPNIDAILKELGPPAQLSRAGTGLVFLYEYARIEERQFGLHFAQDWLSLFKFALGRADLFYKTLYVVFDDEGFVLSHAFDEGREELGSGASVQLFFNAATVVDTSNLDLESSQHRWGGSLLEPLPVVLNSRQSLDNGKSGVESFDAPSGVGQRTLENP